MVQDPRFACRERCITYIEDNLFTFCDGRNWTIVAITTKKEERYGLGFWIRRMACKTAVTMP